MGQERALLVGDVGRDRNSGPEHRAGGDRKLAPGVDEGRKGRRIEALMFDQALVPTEVRERQVTAGPRLAAVGDVSAAGQAMDKVAVDIAPPEAAGGRVHGGEN